MQEEDVDEMDDEHLPGWGHWAMPDGNEMIDQETEDGEFLELADIMQPLEEQPLELEPPMMDNNSEIIVSFGSNANLEGHLEVEKLAAIGGKWKFKSHGLGPRHLQWAS